MLKDRHTLETMLQNKIVDISQDIVGKGVAVTKKEIINKLYEKYNIPFDLSSDLLSFRKDLSEASVLIIFALTDVLLSDKLLRSYFTQIEIDTLGNTKYETEKPITTMTFKMIQVVEDQWIGVSDARTLMKLRDRQMIHYNADTQRALKKVIRHGNIIMVPYLNMGAVSDIADLYDKNEFIPNTITLNLPEYAEYSYDSRSCELTVDTDYFDITDGYHRYVAMGYEYDNKKDFNYPTELRITVFPTVRAQGFAWQEDHKTKMKVIDSKYLNPSDYGNRIVRRLDEDSNLRGKINNKDGFIYAPFLAECVNKIWKPKSNKEVVDYTKDIRTLLNRFTEDHVEYLEKKWNKFETLVIFYSFYRQLTSDQTIDFINHVDVTNCDINATQTVRKRHLEELEKVVKRYV